MTRLPRALRLFWAAYITLMIAALLAPSVGPVIEARVDPIRVGQSIKDVHRDRTFLRFAWISRKLRAPEFIDIDVGLITPHDRFVVTLFTNLGADKVPAAPPCTDIAPWSRSHAPPIGPLKQHFCVEVPRTVDAGEPVDLPVTVRYRGWLGLWDVPVQMPTIRSETADGL